MSQSKLSDVYKQMLNEVKKIFDFTGEVINDYEEDVDYYLRAQRAHQNNVEFMSVFMPLFLIIGLFEPKKTAIGGLIVLTFRIIGGLGYLYNKREFGAAFHLGELYILFLGFQIVYSLLKIDSVD